MRRDCIVGYVSYVGDLLGQLNGLGDSKRAILDGTLHVDILDLLAQIGLGADKTDQAVLDLQRDVCALFDGLAQGAGCLDNEVLSTSIVTCVLIHDQQWGSGDGGSRIDC